MAEIKQNNIQPDSKESRNARKRRRERTSLILILVGVVFVMGAFIIAYRKPGSSLIEPPRIGAPMSEIALTSLDGRSIRVSDYRGKLLLINTWATWCPPCKAEMPALQAYYDTHRQDGFEMVAINDGEDSGLVQEFIAQKGFTFPVLLDPNSDTLVKLGINNLPTSILVGRDGVIRTIHVGLFSPEQLEAEITPLLQQ